MFNCNILLRRANELKVNSPLLCVILIREDVVFIAFQWNHIYIYQIKILTCDWRVPPSAY